MGNPTVEELSDGTRQVTWGAGYAQIKRLGPGLFFFRQAGSFVAPGIFEAVIPPFDAELKATGHLVLFCDCERMGAFAKDYREKWASWAAAHRAQAKIHVYTKSGVIRLALAAINLISGGVFSYSGHWSDIEKRLTESVKGFQPGVLPTPLEQPSVQPV